MSSLARCFAMVLLWSSLVALAEGQESVFTPWSQWSVCSKTCGDKGRQTRFRTCNPCKKGVNEVTGQVQTCNTQDCPVCEPVNPCRNGGACIEKGNSKFACACVPGWTGDICENEIDECAVKPCLNGGTCTDHFNAFTCGCPSGFSGATCETIVEKCLLKPCQNGGTCSNLVNDFSCRCRAGFRGKTCQRRDPCFPNPCQNGGVCTDLVFDFRCRCPVQPSGKRCEQNFCQGRKDGNYENPTKCNRYIACSGEITYNMPCATKHVYYNAAKDKCLYRKDVDCSKRGGYNTD